MKSPTNRISNLKEKESKNKNRSKSNNLTEEIESGPQYSQSPINVPSSVCDINQFHLMPPRVPNTGTQEKAKAKDKSGRRSVR